jgi:hypothetical protein
MTSERNLDALIYTRDRAVSARCAAVFADLPVNWINLDDPRFAAEMLGTSQYDFVLLDLDSARGTELLPHVRPDADSRRHGVILALTDGGIDGDILEMSYESLIFYPVRLQDLDNAVHRAIPLAERLAAAWAVPPLPLPRRKELVEVAEELTPFAEELAQEDRPSWISQLKSFFAGATQVKMHHSLSIVWQERIASGISAAGTIWYVHEVTKDWSAFAFLIPSTPGPFELIGISVLLWVCAKHRRWLSSSEPAAEPVAAER